MQKYFSILFTVLYLTLATGILHPVNRPQEMPNTNELAFDEKDAKVDLKLQGDLERRASMLRIHQWLGIVTAIPMLATYFLGDDFRENPSIRDWHMGLGIATTTLYTTSAGFAIFAPKPDGITDTGSSKIHRWLSYIHAPLMIIAPILGNMARTQIENGERVSGIAKLHGAAATTLLATFLTSIVVLSFNFNF